MSTRPCPRCSLVFGDRDALEDHLRADHPASTAPATTPAVLDLDPPRISVLLDPDRPAAPAIEVAAALARRCAGALELVAVADGSSGRAVDTALRVEAARHADLVVSTTRLAGPVVDAVLGHLAAATPDLVALDSHGRGPFVGRLLGSVSADVVRSSPAPTLVVGPECRLDQVPTALVVALDGSDESDEALSVADVLGARLGLETELVTVADPTRPVSGVDVREVSLLRRAARSFEPPLRRWDVLHASMPSAALAGLSEERPDVVLVLGSHGRSAARDHVLGRVSARTVRHAATPVLVVGPEAAARCPVPPTRRAAVEA